VNDTREEKSGNVVVKDADTGETIFSFPFVIPAKDKILIGTFPEESKQAMWLIDFTIGNGNFANHYLSGKAPFKLEDYQQWFKKLNIKRDELQ